MTFVELSNVPGSSMASPTEKKFVQTQKTVRKEFEVMLTDDLSNIWQTIMPVYYSEHYVTSTNVNRLNKKVINLKTGLKDVLTARRMCTGNIALGKAVGFGKFRSEVKRTFLQ